MYSICKFCISQRQAITRCGQCNYIRGLIQPHHCLENYIPSTKDTHILQMLKPTLIGNTCRAFTESFDGTTTETWAMDVHNRGSFHDGNLIFVLASESGIWRNWQAVRCKIIILIVINGYSITNGWLKHSAWLWRKQAAQKPPYESQANNTSTPYHSGPAS